jgi:hypothetical protein
MSLEATLGELNEQLSRLEQSLDNLLWAVVQGQPQTSQGHALLDYYEAAASDLLGLVKESRAAAQSLTSADNKPEAAQARAALLACQEHFNRIVGRYYNELTIFDRIMGLHHLAQQRRGEWAWWTKGVQDALRQCPQPLHDMAQALLNGWRDLTVSLGKVEAHQKSVVKQELRLVRGQE